jgi:hypothetical protein
MYWFFLPRMDTEFNRGIGKFNRAMVKFNVCRPNEKPNEKIS